MTKLVVVALVACFLLWRTQGGLALACGTWILAFLYLRTLPQRLKGLTLAWMTVLLGMFCNAAVTLANGGVMPVLGLPRGFKPIFPAWAPARSSHHFLVLADQQALAYCSVGDLLVVSGVLLWWAGLWLCPRVKRAAEA